MTGIAEFPIIIGTVEKNSREKVRVAIDTYKGHTFLDIRVFVDGDDGPQPTKKGLTIKVDRISDLRSLLEAAAIAAAQRGIT